MRKTLILVLFGMSMFSCHKTGSSWLRATVVGKDGNCHLPLLDFSEDSSQIQAITGLRHQSFCIAVGLPDKDTSLHTRLQVQVVQPGPDESVYCITLFQNYPEVKVVAVK